MEEATGQSQMQEAFLQRMTSMAEAATRAAMAAEKALEKTSSSGGASSIEVYRQLLGSSSPQTLTMERM